MPKLTVREACLLFMGFWLGFALASSVWTHDWSWFTSAAAGACVGLGLGLRARKRGDA